jgi:hypothetical protein
VFQRDAQDYPWEMFDPVCNGRISHAWSLSSNTSQVIGNFFDIAGFSAANAVAAKTIVEG